MKTIHLCALLSIAVAGCGGGSDATHVDGMLEGTPLVANIAVAKLRRVPVEGGGGLENNLIISLGQRRCDEDMQVGDRALDIVIVSPKPIGEGIYELDTPKVFASGTTVDQCRRLHGMTSDKGTVTLDSTFGGNYHGSFDVTLLNGDHLVGYFSGAPCTRLDQPGACGPR
jgi:hypothetical protein